MNVSGYTYMANAYIKFNSKHRSNCKKKPRKDIVLNYLTSIISSTCAPPLLSACCWCPDAGEVGPHQSSALACYNRDRMCAFISKEGAKFLKETFNMKCFTSGHTCHIPLILEEISAI